MQPVWWCVPGYGVGVPTGCIQTKDDLATSRSEVSWGKVNNYVCSQIPLQVLAVTLAITGTLRHGKKAVPSAITLIN